jgi:hypothetical protein
MEKHGRRSARIRRAGLIHDRSTYDRTR